MKIPKRTWTFRKFNPAAEINPVLALWFVSLNASKPLQSPHLGQEGRERDWESQGIHFLFTLPTTIHVVYLPKILWREDLAF